MNAPRIEGLDLAKVKADADVERDRQAALRKANEEAAIQQAQASVERWHRRMNRTFKGIQGGSSLHRRFFLRAEGSRIESGRKPSFKGMGG